MYQLRKMGICVFQLLHRRSDFVSWIIITHSGLWMNVHLVCVENIFTCVCVVACESLYRLACLYLCMYKFSPSPSPSHWKLKWYEHIESVMSHTVCPSVCLSVIPSCILIFTKCIRRSVFECCVRLLHTNRHPDFIIGKYFICNGFTWT